MADEQTSGSEVGSDSGVTDMHTAVTEMRWQVARLEKSLEQIRSALVGAASGLVGGLLLAAVVVPLVQLKEHDRRDDSYSLLRVVGAGFSAKTDDGSTDGWGIFVGGAFLLLLIVMVTAVVALGSVGRRRGSPRQASWGTAVAVVLLLGTAGAWLTTLLESRESWWRLNPGIILLTLGAIGFAVLMFSSTFASLWVNAEPKPQPMPRSILDDQGA